MLEYAVVGVWEITNACGTAKMSEAELSDAAGESRITFQYIP